MSSKVQLSPEEKTLKYGEHQLINNRYEGKSGYYLGRCWKAVQDVGGLAWKVFVCTLAAEAAAGQISSWYVTNSQEYVLPSSYIPCPEPPFMPTSDYSYEKLDNSGNPMQLRGKVKVITNCTHWAVQVYPKVLIKVSPQEAFTPPQEETPRISQEETPLSIKWERYGQLILQQDLFTTDEPWSYLTAEFLKAEHDREEHIRTKGVPGDIDKSLRGPIEKWHSLKMLNGILNCLSCTSPVPDESEILNLDPDSWPEPSMWDRFFSWCGFRD